MSTKLEDLSISDQEDTQYQEDFEYFADEEESISTSSEKQIEIEKKEDMLEFVYKIFYEKIKDPLLVVFLVSIFTNKYILEFLHSISFLEVIENSIGLNIFLSIVIGILFLVIREFV